MGFNSGLKVLMDISVSSQYIYHYLIGSKINTPNFNVTNMFKFDGSKDMSVEISTQNSESIGSIHLRRKKMHSQINYE
jgi:hypothetical protein